MVPVGRARQGLRCSCCHQLLVSPPTLAGGRAGPPAPGWLLLAPGSKASGGGCSYHGADAVRGGGADGVVVRVCRCVHSAVTRSKHSGGR